MPTLRLKHFVLSLVCVAVIFTHPRDSVAQQSQRPAESTPQPSEGGRMVVLTVIVTNDKHEYVWGLDKSLFSLSEGKDRRDISVFKAEDVPFSMGILFDTSGSMKMGGARMSLPFSAAAEGLSSLLEVSHASSEYFLMNFADHPQVLVDWTSDRRALTEKLASFRPTGITSLYKATRSGLEKLESAKYPKRILLVLSDGLDTDRENSYKELRRELDRTDAIIYTIGFTDPTSRPMDAAGEQALMHWSELTGGMSLFPKSGPNLKRAFEIIAMELRYQYTIGFIPNSDTGNTTWRMVRIKVSPAHNAPSKMRKLRVRNSRGFSVSQ